MSKKKTSSLMILLAGIVIGFVILLSIGAILSWIDPGTELTGHFKTFGDIKVSAQKSLVVEDENIPEEFYQEAHKVLLMTKDAIPFLMIHQDKEGKISNLYLLRGNYIPVLTLEPSKTPGKWVLASYGVSDGTGKPIGDTFIDIDFNGSFDFKIFTDDTGNLLSRSIFLDGVWQEADKCNIEAKRVAIGQSRYVFDPNFGWRLEE